MIKSLMDRKCSNCKHYEPSKSVDYAGVCLSVAVRDFIDEGTLVHRDSWCKYWDDKAEAGVKQNLTTRCCGNCGWSGPCMRVDEVVCHAPTSAADMKRISKGVSPYYYMAKAEGADCEAWKEVDR